jgi:hypothetical protein
MPVFCGKRTGGDPVHFHSPQQEGRNMFTEVLSLGPPVCVLLAVAALVYIYESNLMSAQRVVSSSKVGRLSLIFRG